MARRLISSLFALFIFLAVVVAHHLAEACTVPAIFVFGDSLLDGGTNNFLNESTAKANHPYYGIDYPGSVPTGRFSNGYNCADRIGMHACMHNDETRTFIHILDFDNDI